MVLKAQSEKLPRLAITLNTTANIYTSVGCRQTAADGGERSESGKMRDKFMS